jgi:hypothetical protein
MAYVMLTWLADALRAEGAKVDEYPGWKARGRPSSSGQFNPYGVLWHHTGSTSSATNPAPTLKMCVSGRTDLPGPLCQVVIGFDGTCHVIAAGRANHAGKCSGFGPFVTGDGNWQMVGFEIDYNGTQPMTAKQKDAATRASAACLKRFKHDEEYAARHAETSLTGKWDTGGVTGPQLRAMIRTYMNKGDEDMPLTDADLKKIRTIVNEEVGKYHKDTVTDTNKEKIWISSGITRLLARVSRIEANTKPPGT